MGDREFENFLNGRDNDDDDNEGDFYGCKKRLLFDILQLKIENSTNLIGIFSDLIKEPRGNTAIDYKSKLTELIEISEVSFEQLDMLLTEVIDDMDDLEGPKK